MGCQGIKKQLSGKRSIAAKGAYIKYVEGGGRRVSQIFQKTFHSPGDHRPKYFMAQ